MSEEYAMDYCPNCLVDLKYETLPHITRKIKVMDVRTKAVLSWECPDCGHRWEVE